MTRHAYASAIITMSKKLFDSFPADVRKIMLQAAQEAAVYERAWVAENEARQLADLKSNGMLVVETPLLSSFQEAVQSVYDKYPAYADSLKKIREALK
jgi:TRAP-type C4-dicarboxylate transport system substrate-binding protein